MLLRRATPVAIAIVALACEPTVPYDAANNPAAIDYAGFDPTGSPPSIPLPNDLALQPQAIATQNPAQAALLTEWAKQGFPNDQEAPITIEFVRESLDPATGAVTRSAPDLDLASINPGTVLLLSISSSGSGAVAYDAPKAADYAAEGDHGVLTLHKSPDPATKSRRWPAGTQMVVAVRGGPDGVKVKNGAPGGLQPQPAMYLLLQDRDLTLPENLAILPGQSRSEKAAAAAQLEALRKGYLAPFAAVDASGAFSHREIATMGTFRVAATSRATHVETDPSAGLMPLPSDFLLGPDGRLLPELAASSGPFGPAGPGLATLDGFSATAMILMQTSAPIAAATVNKDSVFLYEVTPANGVPPSAARLAEISEIAQGKAPRFVAEPAAITQTLNGASVSTAIGLQPAVPAPLPNGSLVPVPPLSEATTYVVLVTRRVKDLFGDPLVRSTLGKILLLDPSISIASNGKSKISGVSDAQATALDRMRQAIGLAVGALLAEKGPALSRDDLVMAYTFRTQGITGAAVQLAALPYANPTAALAGAGTKAYCTGNPACTGGTVADVLASYGVDTAAVPTSNVFAVVESTITTFDKLTCPAGVPGCVDTGAFTPAAVPPNPEQIPMLVALPAPPYGGSCVPGPAQVCTIPLAVFRHGFRGGRGDLFQVADILNAQGIAVAAIDAAKHGDRSFCALDSECSGGGACVPVGALAGEGDATAPGRCSSGYARRPVTGTFASAAPSGIPLASGNYLISANFFRTRDSLRQDIIDQSQLIRVLSPNPACDKNAPPTDLAATCANAIVTPIAGVQFDPDRISFLGQSLGAIAGVADVAANPRLRAAALNVGGSTVVDVFTNSPAFAGALGALLAPLGIEQGTPAYLRFLQVAKWILDPADPENFAAHLSARTLPSPLSGNTAPPPRAVLGQLALCDGTVPNAFSLNLYGLAGLGPSAAQPGKGTVTTFVANGSSCPANAVDHGFLGAWGTYGQGATSIARQAQEDIASFFTAGTLPPSIRSTP